MKFYTLLFSAGFAASLVTSSVQAAVVLTIDVSDPAAVVITATGNGASDDSSFDILEGFNLIGFLTSDYAGLQDFPAGVGTLAFSSGGDIDGSYYGNFTFTDDNVTLYGNGGGTATITTGVAPFTGSSVFDWAADLTSYLPGPGAFGDIQGGDLSPVGPVFGQWQVIPEPATYAVLGGLLALGLAAWHRRRRQA